MPIKLFGVKAILIEKLQIYCLLFFGWNGFVVAYRPIERIVIVIIVSGEKYNVTAIYICLLTFCYRTIANIIFLKNAMQPM